MLNKRILKVAAKAMGMSADAAEKMAKPIPHTNAYYFCQSDRGKQAIVDVDGSKLTAGADISYDQLVDDFKDGARN